MIRIVFGKLVFSKCFYSHRYFDFMKTVGYTTECVVNPMFNYSGYHYDVSKTPVYSEWTLYAADHPSTYTWAIYVQKIEKNFVVYLLNYFKRREIMN